MVTTGIKSHCITVVIERCGENNLAIYLTYLGSIIVIRGRLFWFLFMTDK